MCFAMSPQRARALRRSGLETRQFIVGIRPQNLRARQRQRAGFAAEVLINEYLGERSILTVDATATVRFRALVPPDTRVRKGETVRLDRRPGRRDGF